MLRPNSFEWLTKSLLHLVQTVSPAALETHQSSFILCNASHSLPLIALCTAQMMYVNPLPDIFFNIFSSTPSAYTPWANFSSSEHSSHWQTLVINKLSVFPLDCRLQRGGDNICLHYCVSTVSSTKKALSKYLSLTAHRIGTGRRLKVEESTHS